MLINQLGQLLSLFICFSSRFSVSNNVTTKVLVTKIGVLITEKNKIVPEVTNDWWTGKRSHNTLWINDISIFILSISLLLIVLRYSFLSIKVKPANPHVPCKFVDYQSSSWFWDYLSSIICWFTLKSFKNIDYVVLAHSFDGTSDLTHLFHFFTVPNDIWNTITHYLYDYEFW